MAYHLTIPGGNTSLPIQAFVNTLLYHGDTPNNVFLTDLKTALFLTDTCFYYYDKRLSGVQGRHLCVAQFEIDNGFLAQTNLDCYYGKTHNRITSLWKTADGSAEYIDLTKYHKYTRYPETRTSYDILWQGVVVLNALYKDYPSMASRAAESLAYMLMNQTTTIDDNWLDEHEDDLTKVLIKAGFPI